MATENKTPHAFAGHGAARLPAVNVDDYNLEIKDNGGFLGDRASKTSFLKILDGLRKPLKKIDADPFGKAPSSEIGKKAIDAALEGDDPDALGLVQGAIEEFSKQFAFVILRFLKAKGWRDTERIVIGGGTRDSGYGEMAIARAGVIVKGEGVNVDLQPIRHHPDDAGLIGAVQLAPTWIFQGHDSILAVDIGGTNIRAGVVALNLKKAADLSRSEVWKRDLWRHADDKPNRDEAIGILADMLNKLIAATGKEGFKLAPFIGIGCPGRIEPDGSIDRGAQNLPGNWESSKFNLPRELQDRIPRIGDHETVVLMHNDAVVQGLSEAPFMRDIERWGVLTIGTGLGNARFTNRGGSDKDTAKGGKEKGGKDKEGKDKNSKDKDKDKGKDRNKESKGSKEKVKG